MTEESRDIEIINGPQVIRGVFTPSAERSAALLRASKHFAESLKKYQKISNND